MDKTLPTPNFPTIPVDVTRRYSVDLACAYLGIGKDRLYAKITAGEIETITDGRRRFVPGSEIVRLSTVPAKQ
jgi:excisionase family DNA binding protein